MLSPWALEQTKELSKLTKCTVVSSAPNLKIPKFAFSILPQKIKKWSNIDKNLDWGNFTALYPRVPVRTYTRKARFNNSKKVASSWFKAVEKTVDVKKYDIILAHHPMIEGYIASLIKDRYNIPFITIEHSGYDPFHGNSDYKKMYSKVASNADVFVCPSKHVLNSILAKYSVKNPSVIYNGGAIPNEKVEFDLSGKLKFISVGALSEYKNYETLIKAFNDETLRKRSTLKIIGDGPLKNKYQTIINDLGLRNVVTLLGSMKHEKVFQMLDRSDVFVLISNENFSVAAVEALGRGCPVAVSEATGIPEIIKDGVQGFIIKNEDRMVPNRVSQILKKFVEKPEIIPKMSKEAFELSKDFTWEANAKKMYNILLEVTKNR